MCFREGIKKIIIIKTFGDLGAYCGGSRLAEGVWGGASARSWLKVGSLLSVLLQRLAGQHVSKVLTIWLSALL